MKKLIIGMAIATISMGAHAGRFDIDVNINGNDRIKNCRENVKRLKAQNVSLQRVVENAEFRLRQCTTDLNNRGNNRQVRQLKADLVQANNTITRLENTVDRKNDKIQDLKRDIQKLQDQLNPPQTGFNLAAAIRACSGINNSSYSSFCASSARKYKVRAKVIEACTSFGNAYYAAECVDDAGEFGAGARQVEECALIQNDVYAGQCVVSAAKGNVSPAVISACRSTSSNAYFQAECVEESRER